MQNISLIKHQKYIFTPDLCYKMLNDTSLKTSSSFPVFLVYNYSSSNTYEYIALKALFMLSSIYPRRVKMGSQIIIVKFAKTRISASVYLKISLRELVGFFSYFLKKPVSVITTMFGHIKEGKHFSFPGFVKYLKVPSWNKTLNLCFSLKDQKVPYLLLMYKTAYLD